MKFLRKLSRSFSAAPGENGGAAVAPPVAAEPEDVGAVITLPTSGEPRPPAASTFASSGDSSMNPEAGAPTTGDSTTAPSSTPAVPPDAALAAHRVRKLVSGAGWNALPVDERLRLLESAVGNGRSVQLVTLPQQGPEAAPSSLPPPAITASQHGLRRRVGGSRRLGLNSVSSDAASEQHAGAGDNGDEAADAALAAALAAADARDAGVADGTGPLLVGEDGVPVAAVLGRADSAEADGAAAGQPRPRRGVRAAWRAMFRTGRRRDALCAVLLVVGAGVMLAGAVAATIFAGPLGIVVLYGAVAIIIAAVGAAETS